MDSQRLTLVLLICLFCSVTLEQVQVPTLHPELIAGSWESASSSGIDGIFFNISTSSEGQVGHGQITSQTINIRVYHRQGGKETWGWFTTNDKATPESYSMHDDQSFTLFDGERLRIHSADFTELKPFDLDITFSPTERVWTGTWSRFGQACHVVLERPNPNAGITVSAFLGDWESEPDPNSEFHAASGSLHIRESSDGVLSAWLDRTISFMDARTRSVHSNQRNGEPLRVNSVTDSGIILETNYSAMGPDYQYRGNLSQDRRALTGIWASGRGGRLNAPVRFRRAS